MRSTPMCGPGRCSTSSPKRRLRETGRRGAPMAQPSFKDAGARLGDALAAMHKAETKLAQARRRVEAAARRADTRGWVVARRERTRHLRSEENTYALQSLMRISYAVFCLK